MAYPRRLLLGLPWLAFLFACVPCHHMACDGGFVLKLVAAQGLSAGEYEVALELEGEAHRLICTLDANGSGDCVEGETTSGFGIASLVYQDNDLTQIRLRIVDGRESAGDFYAHRGPEAVEVEVTLAGEVVGAASYEPSYERIDYRGDEACGYCDQSVNEQLLLSID